MKNSLLKGSVPFVALLVSSLAAYALTAQSVHFTLSVLLSGLLVGSLAFFFYRYPQYISLPYDDGRALALVRILSAGLLIYQLIRVKFLNTIKLPAELTFDGTFVSLLQSLPYYSAISTDETALTVLFVITLYLLGFALFGYKSKYTVPLSALAYILTYSFVLQYYNIWHEGIVPLTILASLSLSPASDRYSLDALGLHIKKKPTHEYSASLLIVFAVTALTYLSLGASKLLHSNIQWMHPDNLRGHLLGAGYEGDGSWVDTLLVSAPDSVFLIAGCAIILLQVGFISTLFFKHARVVFPLFGILFSVAIMFFMHIYFYDLVLINLLLLSVTLYFWKENAPQTSSSLKIPKRTLGTLGVVFLIFFSQWHGYVENFPFTSWDMYSGKSQFSESNYKNDQTVLRYRFLIEYADGTTRYFFAPMELSINAIPGKCQYRYEPRFYDDCHAFYNHAARELYEFEQKRIAAFVVSRVTLLQKVGAGAFTEINSEDVRFPVAY